MVLRSICNSPSRSFAVSMSGRASKFASISALWPMANLGVGVVGLLHRDALLWCGIFGQGLPEEQLRLSRTRGCPSLFNMLSGRASERFSFDVKRNIFFT